MYYYDIIREAITEAEDKALKNNIIIDCNKNYIYIINLLDRFSPLTEKEFRTALNAVKCIDSLLNRFILV